jgi:2'-5' RNA ligase
VTEPLIVTLVVDDLTQTAWDDLRRRWFPPERLLVGAHVTLFHALPGRELDAVVRNLAEVAAMTEPFALAVPEAASLGRGVALRVRSAALDRLHGDLARRWQPWLTPQDAKALWAHVTIQNKVSPDEARDTLAEVTAAFTPHQATATGLALWRYLDGPWQAVTKAPFRANHAAAHPQP